MEEIGTYTEADGEGNAYMGKCLSSVGGSCDIGKNGTVRMHPQHFIQFTRSTSEGLT